MFPHHCIPMEIAQTLETKSFPYLTLVMLQRTFNYDIKPKLLWWWQMTFNVKALCHLTWLFALALMAVNSTHCTISTSKHSDIIFTSIICYLSNSCSRQPWIAVFFIVGKLPALTTMHCTAGYKLDEVFWWITPKLTHIQIKALKTTLFALI